jgi:hypothetical protein
VINYPPNGDLVGILMGAGAGDGLTQWMTLSGGIGTKAVSYILVGRPGARMGNGFETLSFWPLEEVPHTTVQLTAFIGAGFGEFAPTFRYAVGR